MWNKIMGVVNFLVSIFLIWLMLFGVYALQLPNGKFFTVTGIFL